jgi:membrane associated rhomboid family serine protease
MLRNLAADLRGAPWPVWLILLLCLMPELLFSAVALGLVDAPRARAIAFDNFGFWAGLLGNWQPNYSGQPWLMFLSYGFLHAGPVHFLVNMLTLLALGGPVAQAVGPRRFLALYLMFAVAGAIGFALWPAVGAPMVGASGALFGLAGLLLAWDWAWRRRRGLPLGPALRSLGMLLLLNLVLWYAMGGHLAWQTHLGGFVAGWVMGWIVPPGRR